MKLSEFVKTILIGLTLANVTTAWIPLKFGYVLDNAEIIRTLALSSWEQCYNECLARKRCLSIEYRKDYRICRLSSSDTTSTGVRVIQHPGTVYSEKSTWNEKYLNTECTNCSDVDTCLVNENRDTCAVLECSEPTLLNAQSRVLGNQLSVGSKVLHKCRDIANVSAISECLPTGAWSLKDFTCPTVDLDGKRFKIISSENNKYWHYDGSSSKYVSSRWQPNDNFVKFVFERQTDGTYQIRCQADSTYMYDSYQANATGGNIKPYLNGIIHTNDDNMRYIVTMETEECYRIQTKATNRYVRLDPDKFVSSRYNIRDSASLFKLEEV